MKFYTRHGGLRTLFRPFWLLLRWRLWDLDGKSRVGLNLGQARMHPLDKPEKAGASVTSFPNGVVDEGVLEHEDGTGRGGHHRIYHLRSRNLNYKPQEKVLSASYCACTSFHSILGRGKIVRLHA